MLLRTIEDVQAVVGTRIIGKETVVTPRMVKLYGDATGDIQKHNYASTATFPEPVVQGGLLVGLFAGFQKSICGFGYKEYIRRGGSDQELSGVRVNQIITPCLTVIQAKKTNDIIFIEWLCEITDANKCLAKLTVQYYYKLP